MPFDTTTLIIAAVALSAVSVLVTTPLLAWILGRQREKAIDALAAYAAAGREPPVELRRVAANPLKVFG